MYSCDSRVISVRTLAQPNNKC